MAPITFYAPITPQIGSNWGHLIGTLEPKHFPFVHVNSLGVITIQDCESILSLLVRSYSSVYLWTLLCFN